MHVFGVDVFASGFCGKGSLSCSDGGDGSGNGEVEELIFERSRYTYNDALDEFRENYKQNIRDVFLVHQSEESEESDDKVTESSPIF